MRLHLHLPHPHMPHLGHDDLVSAALLAAVVLLVGAIAEVFMAIFAKGPDVVHSAQWFGF